MNPLKINIFFVPVIALILVIVLYIKLSKSVINKSAFNRFILFVIILSYLLNVTWELVQVPLYKRMIFNNHTVLCAVASLADVIMVLLLYFGLAIIYKDAFWVKNLSFKRIVMVITTGAVGAIVSESRHIAAGNWAYAESMPILPMVSVGLSPVLQFTILPVLIYYLSAYFLKFWD